MKLLLSDGSGLTARQTATILAGKGHEVHVVAPDPICLARWTRHVRRVHRVPAFGLDPLGWFDATAAIARDGGFDVVVPTQEQVTILSREAARLGVATVVPPFEALVQVQDKISAAGTLSRLGIPQPPSWLAASPSELLAVNDFPVFVKPPIGTAGTGIEHARDHDALRTVADRIERAGLFDQGQVLAQRAVVGPLAMLQSVFHHGELVAFHANLRVRAGSNNGAALKRSIHSPSACAAIEHLGNALGWHGALSADAILADTGPVLIDINPRLVEPTNALLADVDLVGALLSAAQDETITPIPTGREGVLTHQTLIAMLGAAQRGEGRTGALRELTQGFLRTGPYRGSHEELTPARHDPRAALPVLVVAAALTLRPAWWRAFSGGAVENYALSPAAWKTITGH